MVNVTIIFGLLVPPYLVATLFHLDHPTMAGRIGVCAVLLFTAIGHFLKTDSMIPMLPPIVPARLDLPLGNYRAFVCRRVCSVAQSIVCRLDGRRLPGRDFSLDVYATFQRISFGGTPWGRSTCL